MMRILLLLFTSLFFTQLLAQDAPPNTNVYLFNLSKGAESLTLTEPRFLTRFNQYGYNNQPRFIGNSSLLLTVQIPGDTQTDLYLLNLKDRIKTRFTATYESEYSPQIISGAMGKGTKGSTRVSCIRVATDDNATQYLWEYPLDRSNQGKAILDDLTGIGYYAWSGMNKLALFVVGEPHTLVVANLLTGDQITVTSDIGRCLQRFPNGDVAFVQMIDDKTWLLKRLNMATYQPELVTAMLEGVEDFVLLNDGTVIIGKGSKLYKFNRNVDISWKEVADLSSYGIRNITRMAVSSDGSQLAIVN